MLLGEFFTQLSYGELSGLGIIADEGDTISLVDRPRVVGHTNSALGVLSQEIPYNLDYVKFAASADRSVYIIDNLYALSNTDPGNTAPRYIQDTAEEPFDATVIKIREITRLDIADTTDIDETLITSINKRETTSGIGAHVSGTNKIRLPNPMDGDIYKVEYQARASRLNVVPNLNEVIDITPALETVLELSVAARVFGTIGNELATMRSRELWQRYGAAMELLKSDDTMSQTETDGFDRLRDKGFV